MPHVGYAADAGAVDVAGDRMLRRAAQRDMGMRSKRFALFADDGVLKILHVESPGEFRVSSAEAMLDAIGD